MDDVTFDNPGFRPEEGYRPEPEQDLTDFIVSSETAPLIPSGASARADFGVPTSEFTPRERVLRSAVDDFYKRWERSGIHPELRKDYNNFEYSPDGTLRLKAFPELRITKRNGEPLALTTISTKPNGLRAIRYELGFPNWGSRLSVKPADVAAFTKTEKQLADAGNKAAESVALDDFLGASAEAKDTVEELVASLSQENTEEEPPPVVTTLKKEGSILGRINTKLSDGEAKLKSKNDYIALEQRKLETEGITEDEKNEIRERIERAEAERDELLANIEKNKNALRSQINRIRETVRRILHEDTTLAERIRTLFREQGITIMSILTAIGMIISTLVFALTGSVGGGSPQPTPTPKPSDKGGVKEWVKKTLQSLGRALAKLAGKAAAALPGIIGSIVSWLLTLLSKTAGWLAQNLWAIVVAVGGLLLMAAREFLVEKPKRG